MANSRVLVGFSFVGTTLAAVIALFWYWNKRDPDQNIREKKSKDRDAIWLVDDQESSHTELSPSSSSVTQSKPENDMLMETDDDLIKSEKTNSLLSPLATEAEINQNKLDEDVGNILGEMDDAGITRNRNFFPEEKVKPVVSEQSRVENTLDITVEPELKSQADDEKKPEDNSTSEDISPKISVPLDTNNVLNSDHVVTLENVAPLVSVVTDVENETPPTCAEGEVKIDESSLIISSDSDEGCEKSNDSSPGTVTALLISENTNPVSVPENLPAELEYVISKESFLVGTSPSSEEMVTDLNGIQNSGEAVASPADVNSVLDLQASVSSDSLEASPEPEIHLRSQPSQNGTGSSQSVTKGDNLECLVKQKVAESTNDLDVRYDAESEEENQSVVSGSNCDKHSEMNSSEREPSQSTESGLSRDSLEPLDTSHQTKALEDAEMEQTHDDDSGLLLTPTDPNATGRPAEVAEKAETPSNSCDNTSEASNDSGKGTSVGETMGLPQQPEMSIYQMDFPTELCGRLIGRYGKNINYMKEKTGAVVTLRNNPFSPDFQICTIEGLPHEIEETLAMIRQKFPKSRYPNLQLTPNNMAPEPPVVLPDLQMNLPHGVSVDVIVSSIVNAGLVFLQQPTHPTFPSLERLNQFMLACYTQDQSVPQLPRPVEAGVICAAPVMNGWYRALVVDLSEDGEECDIKFVDYGGYSRLPISHLRQIRSDFMTLPFQAVECYMANITPIQGDMYFNSDGASVLEELTQGKLLQAQVVGRAEDGIPFVHIYQVSGNKALFVNREMVNRGVARWIERL